VGTKIELGESRRERSGEKNDERIGEEVVERARGRMR